MLGLGLLDEDDKAAPNEETVSMTLDRLPADLKVVGLIGRGGMGVVYQARQIELDRIVALKILSPQLAEEPEFTVRFAREARLMAKLNHPHIVTIHHFGSSEGFCYLVMEYVEGRSLADVIDEGTLETSEALSLGLKICSALRFAHRQGVIHRDIKPENILIDELGEPKVTDFGLAKLVDTHPNALALTLPAQSLGTPYYMAPEQRDNPMGTDERADVYALGVTLYQLLTGQLPTGRFPLPSECCDVSPQFDKVILRAMQTDRELRHADAGEFYLDLRSLDAAQRLEEPVEKPAPSVAASPTPSSFSSASSVVEESPPLVQPSGKSVFLAFVSGDLEHQRERLKRDLLNAGHRVVPTTSALPLNGPQAESIIRSALMTADLAIQPVGCQYGWIPDASDRSIVEIQHLLTTDESRRRQIDRVVWVPHGFHSDDDRLRRFMASVHHEADLSRSVHITNEPIDSFIGKVLDTLSRSAPSTTVATPVRQTPHIYLINEMVDEESADRVEDYLFDLGFEITRPTFGGSAEEMEAAHRRNLASCDAALIYYAEARKAWVDAILLDLKNAVHQPRGRAIPVQGVLIGPPRNRQKDRFRTHIAEVMRFDSEFAEIVLEPFVVQVAESMAPATS